MSANKRRRNNNNTAYQIDAAEQDVRNEGMPIIDVDPGSDCAAAALLDMPRVCRCCGKGDMELLKLFETAANQTTTALLPLRRRATTTPTAAAASGETSPQQQQQRKSVNPVDYTLSGQHSSMDTVLEEMIIWMLNISRDDGLPQEICRQCTAQFVMVAKFRRRCVRVQQRLHECAQDLAVRKQQSQKPLANEDYMHLPESQMERKRRLVLHKVSSLPKQANIEGEQLPRPPKQRRLQQIGRHLSIASLTANSVETETVTATATKSIVQLSELRHRPPYKRNVPWKTKAARKQISDSSSASCSKDCRSDCKTPENSEQSPKSQNSETEAVAEGNQTSPEQLSDLSVNPCHGFESEGNSCNSSPKSESSPEGSSELASNDKLEFPRKRIRCSPNKTRVLRRLNKPCYAPVRRKRRVLKRNTKEAVQEIVECSLKQLGSEPNNTITEAIEKLNDSPSDEAPTNGSAETTCDVQQALSGIADEQESKASENTAVEEAKNEMPSELQDQPTSQSNKAEEEQAVKSSPQTLSNQTQDSIEKIETISKQAIEINGTAEEELISPLQLKELSSSMDHMESLQSLTSEVPTVPAAECEVEVSIPSEEDKSELIVSIPLDSLDEQLQRKLCSDTKPETEIEVHQSDVEQKEPVDVDDVNNNENGEHFCQSATADSFNAAVALENPQQIEAQTIGGDNDNMESLGQLAELQPVLQPPRAVNPTPMDFLAEFEKHCEKTLKVQSAGQELEEAKQQLAVEMNDVESTLHGILNEMQDEHLYTPVCTPIDEFLTPADYSPPTPASPSLYEPPAEQQKEQDLKQSNLFDSSTFSNELIGFQNDMPCFENIEATQESVVAQQSLQLELSQLLNELQPPQQIVSQQQPLQLPQETVSYETLYQSSPSTNTNNKLQLIQMTPQETLWQAQQQQQQATTTTTAQLQWSTVGGLETIKTTPSLENLDTSSTTTYYINASDFYQAQQQQSDSYDNYVLEQQQQQQQLQQQQQQPIMILIQQPEVQQPVASASNPQQAPLHISYNNELQPYQQLQQHAQHQHQPPQQQHTQQLPQPHPQQVQNTVLGLPAAVPRRTRGRPPILKCRFCQNGPRFSSSLEYSRHIIELHPAVAPFNCPHCPLAFAGRSKRSQHILTHHVVQQFHCGQCSQMFPSQRALDLHLQRFHMPLATEPMTTTTTTTATAAAAATSGGATAATGVRLEEVQLHLATTNDQQQQPRLQHQSALHRPALEQQANPSQPRRTRILCCPDCEDCSTASGHNHGSVQPYEELSNLQTPPTVLTPPSTIASLPSPQPLLAPHITMPSPEQSEPDSTTASLRQFRKRCPATTTTTTVAAATTTTGATTLLTTNASPSPSSSPSSSTMEMSTATLHLDTLRGSHLCVICDKRFTNIIALRKHQQLAHDSQTTMPWVCSICKRGYRKRIDMDNHMKSHEPKGRPYECNECWVRFPEFKQLAMHKFTVHELIKPHTCDECGKQFGTESALKTHIKFHGERGFECEECDESFFNIKDLRKHRRTHNSELFYKCEYCPRTFLHFTSYRAHMNTHLPLGVFLNDKMPSSLCTKIENPATPATTEESLPLTPLSHCNGNSSSVEDCPSSVEMVGSSISVPSLEMIVDTP